MHVWVLRGETLPNKSAFGTSDPFVQIYYKGTGGQKSVETQVKNNDLNPTWNEKFEFPIVDSTQDNDFTFTVFDKTSMGRKKLAQGEMSLRLVFDYKGNIDVTISLHPKGKLVTHCEWVPDDWGEPIYQVE